MAPRVQHLIETRFSVSMGRASAFHSRAWLEERIDLLRRFCLPSVAGQTCDEFTWLVLCDESTDAEALAELRGHAHDLPPMLIVSVGSDRTRQAAVQSAVEEDVDVLITTRLDSDDALAKQYVEAVHAYAGLFHCSAHPRLLVNFPRGYRLDVRTDKLYHGHMPNSPFHSLLERPRQAPPETVLASGHAGLHRRFFTHQDESIAAWLIAVHGGNVVNRIPWGAREAPLEGPLSSFALG